MLEDWGDWGGSGGGGWNRLLLLQAEVLLQLLKPEQQLIKGGALVLVRVHAPVPKLLQCTGEHAA